MNAMLKPALPPIFQIAHGFDVAPLLAQIDAHPDVWNRHTMRTEAYGTPHAKIDDIWVRYNAWENFTGDIAAFNGPHASTWYPVVNDIPAVKPLVFDVMRLVEGEQLGGVLITRVPPGGRVEPHIDDGWHASYYHKIAVQLRGNAEQAFCFDDAELRPMPGDVYTFDNSQRHWVVNESHDERITLIICIRGSG
ncbi:hypothetical protein GCM10009126_27580 [Rhodanobacter caeni]|uniref:Aspartyl/asparaginy/proline hydroxylase domain-containing protein n=2 Tax=Rhodanobacter caeni TaxID=657654 RepID=A0ABN0UT34_9GAMM